MRGAVTSRAHPDAFARVQTVDAATDLLCVVPVPETGRGAPMAGRRDPAQGAPPRAWPRSTVLRRRPAEKMLRGREAFPATVARRDGGRPAEQRPEAVIRRFGSRRECGGRRMGAGMQETCCNALGAVGSIRWCEQGKTT